MWSKKFGFLVSESITLPFSLFSKTIGLQLQFIGVVFAIVLVISILSLGGMGGVNEVILAAKENRDLVIDQSIGVAIGLLSLAGFFLIFLMILAYIGYVMRLVAGGQNDSSILPVLAFKGHTLQMVWAYIKLIFVDLLMLLPVFLVGVIGYLNAPVDESNVRMMPESVVALTIVFGLIAYIVIIYVGPRLMPVLPSAAIGDGTSLSRAWSISKGYWWLTVISNMVIVMLVAMGGLAFFFLLGITLVPIVYFFSFLPPVLLMIPLVLFYGLLFFSVLTVLSGFLANLYLLQTNRIELKDPEIKS